MKIKQFSLYAGFFAVAIIAIINSPLALGMVKNLLLIMVGIMLTIFASLLFNRSDKYKKYRWFRRNSSGMK